MIEDLKVLATGGMSHISLFSGFPRGTPGAGTAHAAESGPGMSTLVESSEVTAVEVSCKADALKVVLAMGGPSRFHSPGSSDLLPLPQNNRRNGN